jgi:hypothetical protein
MSAAPSQRARGHFFAYNAETKKALKPDASFLPTLPRMTDSRESRAAKIQDSIRQVLYRDRNPIGFGEALPADEYDSYIAPVYRILVGSRSEQELIEFLSSTER